MHHVKRSVAKYAAKRSFDLCVGCGLLILMLPALVLIALLVRTSLGTPVLFRQQRPGRHGKIFTIYKFRTMRQAYDARGRALPDAQRLTPFGRFLRSTSMDELPEIFNVLKGDMSLVGPRPLLKEYLPYYTEREMMRHDVRPGITGWAQINGRNYCPWDKRLELDAWYVENQTIALDIRILFLTFLKVLRREDVAVDAMQAGMPLHHQRRERVGGH